MGALEGQLTGRQRCHKAGALIFSQGVIEFDCAWLRMIYKNNTLCLLNVIRDTRVEVKSHTVARKRSQHFQHSKRQSSFESAR